MKKVLIRLCLLIVLLIPFNIKAAYKYEGSSISISSLKSKGWITTWPAEGTYTYANNSESAKQRNYQYFFYHAAVDGSTIYISHCASIGKYASQSYQGGFTLNINSSIDTLNNNQNNLTNSQRDLLRDLLANGYHYDTTNTKHPSSMYSSKEATLSMMAMQILVWEVVENGRTSFSSVRPQYHEANSMYKKMVYPNGGESNATGTLYYYYKKIVNDVDAAMNPSNATAFNTDTYTMSWDSANKRYSVKVSGLGKYKTCSSSNNNVNVKTSGSTVTLTSTKEISSAKITCSYTVGSGTNNKFFWFNFDNTGSCANHSCQNLVYGSGKKTYSKSFKVKSESTKIKIKKIGIDKKQLAGSKFKLTSVNSPSYSVTLKGNDSATTLNKTGEYIVSETSVPKGYEKIPDFNITIKASTGKVTKCTNKGTDSNGNMTCLNGQVGISYSGNTIILTIVDVAKNFKIKKIDQNNAVVKGATFQIKNSSNQVMKFKLYDGNIFGYNTSGTITDIYLANSYSYPIALLPAGDYTIVETNAPYPYRLPSKESDRSTKIRITSNNDMLVYDETQKKYVSSVDASVKVKNFRTKVKILKTGNGKSIEGVHFALYASNKTTEIKCTTSSAGVYDYVEHQNNVININDYVTNSSGQIIINDLPVGTYYLKETSVPSPFIIPTDENGGPIYTKIVVDVNKSGSTVNGSNAIDTINISNTLSSFNFYKIDEEGNYLKTGKFKLQKYNEKTSRYVDLKLVEVENDGTYDQNADIFKVSDNGKVQFSLTNGIATFIDMEPSSKYRVVETQAPDGYVRQPVNDTAVVTLDKFGNASGLLVLTNEKVLKEDSAAQAELIVNISTGQNRVRYFAIIIGIIVIILGLITIQRKKN